MADADTSLDPGVLDVLSRQVLGGALVVDERRLSGGFSSDNVLLRTDRGKSFVLRRYPRRKHVRRGGSADGAGLGAGAGS